MPKKQHIYDATFRIWNRWQYNDPGHYKEHTETILADSRQQAFDAARVLAANMTDWIMRVTVRKKDVVRRDTMPPTGKPDFSARKILGLEEEETEQMRISIVCDRCFTADFLRQLANAIEEDSAGETFETAHGCAEIDNPDSGDPKKTKTFAGLQIASAPLSFNGKNFVIKDKGWNHDSYGKVCGKVKGSYYFNWEQCHDIKGISHAGHDDWRMPTKDEWWAILFGPRAGSTVNGNSGVKFAKIRLTGVTHAGNSTPVGLLLFPDGLTITGRALDNYTKSTSTVTARVTGSELEAYLNQGCVFLPASGYYYDGSSWDFAGTYGLYWSSSQYDSDFGYYLYFTSSYVYPSSDNNKASLYFPCRLVRKAQ